VGARPPLAVVISFIDAINVGDVGRLASLMSEDHRLQVLDEPPLDGRTANVEAWHGYASSFPDYVIHPHRLVALDDEVAVLGHTTGSHLGLPDDVEAEQTLIWHAVVREGTVTFWQIVEDTPEHRLSFWLAASG
jgi:hypothetical protein